ncbi:MAG TPA: energy transducer TonB [Terriglobales bacterium]|nr:energy transducer TonB [Terriglobales bacterium]
MLRAVVLPAILLLSSLGPCVPVHAGPRSDLQKELRRSYQGKLLSLRSPSSFDVIHFDASGQPTRPEREEPWTTCGLFQARKTYVKANRVDIDGERVIVALNPAFPGTKLSLVTLDREVHVAIDLPASISSTGQLNEFLTKIFFPDDRLQPSINAAWKSTLDLNGELEEISKRAPDGRVGMLAGERPVYGMGIGSITRPKAIYKVQPRYSAKALFHRVSGTIRVRIVVNEKGFPEILEVVQHLGEDLDLRALTAVSQWRFEPALKDGQAVAAMVVVAAKFRVR